MTGAGTGAGGESGMGHGLGRIGAGTLAGIGQRLGRIGAGTLGMTGAWTKAGIGTRT